MRVTICTQQRVVYVAGAAHDLSRTGVNRLFLWLMDNASLQWVWDSGGYVFSVEGEYAANN